ncbi:STAS domain-containing protein [Amycolatopsis sp. WQ 127309]|uniref:STAS domain-containing protein n=1 Tax=Amycolatopsis sp. WQ 127309 TaxID=2932773 RepID=UPI001FF5FD93|nr:STAS domain-containing protein [Amycolatopsis sp. WQ 127309]UOZ03146.1 STAS domain-containing protein [Amycolatopsis sp. WQ 127309]
MKPNVFDFPRPRRPLPESAPASPPVPGNRGDRDGHSVIHAVFTASGGGEPPVPRYHDLAITVERSGWTLVVAVVGEVDLSTAPMLRHALDEALARTPRRIVVDLSFVRFLNTAGLEVLLDAHHRAGPATDLRLVSTTRATWRPLELTRMHERLVVHASRAAAIAAPR